MARRYTTLGIYVGKEFVFSFVVAFLFFFFIFFVNNILLLAEEVLSKRVPVLDVVLLVVYTLPAVVSISFPFASLVGALMAVGRFSSNNELLAFQASGVSRRRIFTPFLLLGIVFTLISFVMNDYFIPLGNINFGKLYRRILLTNPELELESFSVKRYQDAVIITGEVSRKQIRDIVIIDQTAEKDRRVISAREASLSENVEQRSVISLLLSDVFSHTSAAKVKKEYEYFQSEAMIYNILLSDITFTMASPGPREMSSVDVYAALEEKRRRQVERDLEQRRAINRSAYELLSVYRGAAERWAATGRDDPQMKRPLDAALQELTSNRAKNVRDRSIHTYELELYKKFSLPFGCIVFVLFAFPVGMLTKRSGRSVGFGIGLFVSILYWGMLIAGQTFGTRLTFSPFLSMWIPNFVILGAGLIFATIRSTR